jgi:putative oxidoreductase
MLKDNTLLLRITVAIILMTHGVPGMIDGSITDFGNFFLNQIGFSPLGVPIAWLVKLSHVGCAIMLVANKYIKIACLITIFILVMGIILVHFKEGWYVVGGGRNGMEYNIILIAVLVHIMFPTGLTRMKHSQQ